VIKTSCPTSCNKVSLQVSKSVWVVSYLSDDEKYGKICGNGVAIKCSPGQYNQLLNIQFSLEVA